MSGCGHIADEMELILSNGVGVGASARNELCDLILFSDGGEMPRFAAIVLPFACRHCNDFDFQVRIHHLHSPQAEFSP